jgi:hypothetical protein
MAYRFQKRAVVVSCGQPLKLLTIRIPPLTDLFFQNRAIEIGLGLEVAENYGFIDVSLRGQIAGGRAAKAILRKDFHGCVQNVLSSGVF